MSRDGGAALPCGARGFRRFVIVVFSDHTHLLFLWALFLKCQVVTPMGSKTRYELS